MVWVLRVLALCAAALLGAGSPIPSLAAAGRFDPSILVLEDLGPMHSGLGAGVRGVNNGDIVGTSDLAADDVTRAFRTAVAQPTTTTTAPPTTTTTAAPTAPIAQPVASSVAFTG